MNRRKAIQQTAYILGGAVSASVIAGVMSGCKPTKVPDWQPQFFTPEQAELIGEIAETILPETDTPGAKSLHVPEFIDLVIKECFSGYKQLQVGKAINKFEEECQFFTGSNFLNSTSEEREKFIVLHEKKALGAQAQTGEKAFITTLKELVLTGYFTSEYAINELMDYRPIPQAYQGCVETPQKIQVGIEGRSS